MGSVNVRAQGTLFLDFRYKGFRCREYTKLKDSPANRKRLQHLMDRIQQEIDEGTFQYRHYFPNSRQVQKFDQIEQLVPVWSPATRIPRFEDFARRWLQDMAPQWRPSHLRCVTLIVERILLPHFGSMRLDTIRKPDILKFRSHLMLMRGRKSGSTISPSRANHVMNVLKMIVRESAERHELMDPSRNIPSLRIGRTAIHPFTLKEINLICQTVRPDYRVYLITRFLTGMRTAEIDGLKWANVDLERGVISVRETLVDGVGSLPKNESSYRDIELCRVVWEALKTHRDRTNNNEFVFTLPNGKPLRQAFITQRVWYPLLRYLGLPLRNPYQTRHTTATLWLASGESPEWIAKQLGHSSCECLFRVYSRYVPNMVRRDGKAIDQLLAVNLPVLAEFA